jgi:multidrug efflux pump subunit AcrA (membrane-fusion protein)
MNRWWSRSCWITVLASFMALAGGQKTSGQALAPKAPATADPLTGSAVDGSEARKQREPYIVSTSDILDTVTITGELKAARSRDLMSPNIRSAFGSSITFLELEGSEVKKGQRILEFDASTLLGNKAEAERRLDEAKLKIDKTKADLEVQRSDFEIALSQAEGDLKVAQLYAKIDKALLPANTYQKYQLDLEKALLARDKAKEQLANHVKSYAAQIALVEVDRAQAELDLKKIEGDLVLLAVDAPQDGIIIYGDNWSSNRKFQVGDTAFPGMTVLTLPDLSSMQVIGYVYDTELRLLSPNMVCDLMLDAVPGRMWRGKILSLTSVASRKGFASQHKVFRATIQPDGIDLSVMKPGMTVRVGVPVSLASHVVAVPREYLRCDADGRYYVLKGTNPRTATTQFVQVGTFNERLVQVTSGLTAGDKLLEIDTQQTGAKR